MSENQLWEPRWPVLLLSVRSCEKGLLERTSLAVGNPGCGLGSQGLGSVLHWPGWTESASVRPPAAVGPGPHARRIPGSLYWSVELEFDTGFYDQGLVQCLKLGILRARCHMVAAEWTPGPSS